MLSGWAERDKTYHLHDNIAQMIFLTNKRKIKGKKEKNVETSGDMDYTGHLFVIILGGFSFSFCFAFFEMAVGRK